MRLHGLSVHFKRLAFALSLLALWAALIAPASVLAQEMRTGKWIGLCGAGLDTGLPHAEGDGGHCDLCALPALALPPSTAALSGLAPLALELRCPLPLPVAVAIERPAIRDPPFLS